MKLVVSIYRKNAAYSTTEVKRYYVPQTFSTWSDSCRGRDDACPDQQHAQSRDDQGTFHLCDPCSYPCFASLFVLSHSSSYRFLFRSPSHLWFSPHALYSGWPHFVCAGS